MPLNGACPSGSHVGLAGAHGERLSSVEAWKGSGRKPAAERHLSVGGKGEQVRNWLVCGRCLSHFRVFCGPKATCITSSIHCGMSFPSSQMLYAQLSRGTGCIFAVRLCLVTSIALSYHPPPLFLDVFWHFPKPWMLCCGLSLLACFAPQPNKSGVILAPQGPGMAQHNLAYGLVIISVAWHSGSDSSYQAMNITVRISIITTTNDNNAICLKFAVPAEWQFNGTPDHERKEKQKRAWHSSWLAWEGLERVKDEHTVMIGMMCCSTADCLQGA